jgi:hypothetical protein
MGKEDINKTFIFVGSVIAGVLAIILIIYTVIYAPLSCSLAEECKTRAKDDKELQSGISDIKNMLIEVKADVKYLRRADR